MTTENGKIYTVSFSPKVIVKKPLEHKLFAVNHVRCLSLSSSRNNLIFCAVTTPNTTHDHLAPGGRNPTNVHFFSLEGWKDPVDALLRDNVDKSLTNHWDCLELIRFKSTEDANFASTLAATLETSMSSPPTLHELRIALWTRTFRNIAVDKASTEMDSGLKSLIFQLYAADLLLALALKDSLMDKERSCIRLLRTLLKENRTEHAVACERIEEALKVSENLEHDEPEKCALCQATIQRMPWENWLCPSGHQLTRCSATLLQIKRVKFRSCPVCKLMFHKVLGKMIETPACPFCDVPLDYREAQTNGLKPTPDMRNMSVPCASKYKRSRAAADEEDPDTTTADM